MLKLDIIWNNLYCIKENLMKKRCAQENIVTRTGEEWQKIGGGGRFLYNSCSHSSKKINCNCGVACKDGYAKIRRKKKVK